MTENPYQSPSATEPVATDQPKSRARGCMWKRLLFGYAVHHVASAAGMFAACLIGLAKWDNVFPHTVIIVPLLDLVFLATSILNALGAIWQPTYIETLFFLTMFLSVSTNLFALVAYARTARRFFVWYIGVCSIVTYGLYATFMN